MLHPRSEPVWSIQIPMLFDTSLTDNFTSFIFPSKCSAVIPTLWRSSMVPRNRKPIPKWSIYRELHDEVSRLLEEADLHFYFHNNDNDRSCTKTWDTNIMGRFPCRNFTCKSRGWYSRKIAMTIRLYPGQKYNARVYHQRCMNCNRLSRPVLDASYAERVTYWVKQWNGVWVEKPPISVDSKSPHNNELCEGCKAGHCSESSGGLIRKRQRSVNPISSFGSLLICF